MTIQEKVEQLVVASTQGLYEREKIIKLSYLAMLAGESIFLLGPPGVAKSMVARRMKDALKDGKEFEYLMNRFSTPEEIFGPISLSELENDKFERVVDNYLPTADVAFLDEIWKASPSIQNTLLTIINEKLFRNGDKDIEVPLKLLIAASNELPQSGEGLEALYDRFIIREFVEGTQDKESFNAVITGKNVDKYKIKEEIKLTLEEILETQKESSKIIVNDEVLDFIHELRKRLQITLKEKAPYISDRRWKKIVKIIKMSAYISNRKEVELCDLLLIPSMIWETEDQISSIKNIFNFIWINNFTKKTGVVISEINKGIESAKKIRKEAYIDTRIHLSSKDADKNKFYKFKAKDRNDAFWWLPLDEKGELIGGLGGHADYRVFFYHGGTKATKTINSLGTDYYGKQEFTKEKENFNFRNGDLIFEPCIIGKKEKDTKKLEEAKSMIQTVNKQIYILEEKLENEKNKLLKVKSTLIENYSYELEKANAFVNQQLQKFNSDATELLGDVISLLKSK